MQRQRQEVAAEANVGGEGREAVGAELQGVEACRSSKVREVGDKVAGHVTLQKLGKIQKTGGEGREMIAEGE
jgi:hypothetical protein